ncbi:hypothetical protein K6959_05850 [Bacillus aquiflavi]|uniref:hypothetical protein n=1 Tax=Bacillus aquiflavi TaxID=2672567 RepID=UPI001CA86A49|nr:hypothetical protein [Bacillus aquiflavi]UAC49370.1 hypothetical protein K6959_05850 [Bacillus aquiflavi]
MKQKRLRLMICILLLTCTLLFFYRYDTSKVIYVKGFPTKDSPALSEFLRGKLPGSRYNFLYDVNGIHVYTKSNGSRDDKEISFHYNKEDDLKTFYEPLFYTKDVEKTFYNLWENDELTDKIEQQIANKDEFNLPTLKLEEKNQLYV